MAAGLAVVMIGRTWARGARWEDTGTGRRADMNGPELLLQPRTVTGRRADMNGPELFLQPGTVARTNTPNWKGRL